MLVLLASVTLSSLVSNDACVVGAGGAAVTVMLPVTVDSRYQAVVSPGAVMLEELSLLMVIDSIAALAWCTVTVVQ